MNKQFYFYLFAVAFLFISCSNSSNQNEPINALTTLDLFSHEKAAEKFSKVVPISPEDIYGNWEMIASYFTVKDQDVKTTFELEGRKYQIHEDGKLVIDNTALGFDKFNRMWKLQSNNTVFHDGNESWHVRVYNDTMEWIEKIDSDYSYFVLVKR